MPDLSNYLTLADLQSFFDDPADHEKMTEDWRARYHRRLRDIVNPRIGAFFRALKEEGRIVSIPNSAGYRSRRWLAWNAVAALTDASSPEEWDTALQELAGEFAHRFVFDIIYPYEKVLEKEGVEAAKAFDKSVAYQKKIAEFNQGDFPSFTFSHENCWETDLALLLEFTAWVPQGLFISRDGGRCHYLPVPPLEQPTVQETVVVLKTGNLLVNDWFRIPAFTSAVDCDFPVNSRKGREGQTRFYAEQFGFISVSVGNSCAGVFQRDNQVIVGYHDEDEGMPEQLTAHGHVCTDLWAATFIEYENLVDLVARLLPDTAKTVVDAYLGEQSQGNYGLMKLKVEPGTYYLYHYGKHHEFAAKAKEAGISLENSIDEPYFILSKERLLPADKS